MRPEDLEEKVHELEAEIAALRERTLLPPIGIRRRASWSNADLPLYEISLGSDPGRRQLRGHARAVIAIGDVASGVIAIGGYARGVIAIGGLATGSRPCWICARAMASRARNLTIRAAMWTRRIWPMR